MDINLFLWPMLVPMILPLIYCARYKRETFVEIGMISITMVLIVFLYWPLMTSNIFSTYTYIVVKILLFVVLPICIFILIKRNISPLNFRAYGVKKEGLKKSLVWCGILLPIMLVTTAVIQFYNGVSWNIELIAGAMSFFEAFTEEFFFRGILFIIVVQKTTLKVAYATSLMSFLLTHPQNLTTILIIGTLLQGFLTLEIARRSQNIVGAWLLHGSNRFFQLVFIPLFI